MEQEGSISPQNHHVQNQSGPSAQPAQQAGQYVIMLASYMHLQCSSSMSSDERTVAVSYAGFPGCQCGQAATGEISWAAEQDEKWVFNREGVLRWLETGMLWPAHRFKHEGADTFQRELHASPIIPTDLQHHHMLLLGLAFGQGSGHGGARLHHAEAGPPLSSCRLLYGMHLDKQTLHRTRLLS